MVDPVLEEVMTFSSMVGVELTNEMVNINERVSALEMKVEEEKGEVLRAVIRAEGRLEREATLSVGLSHCIEVLEEARRGTQQLLVSFGNERRLEMVRVRSIRVRCSILKSRERECQMDLKVMKMLLEAQMGVINQQMEVIQNLEAQVQALSTLAHDVMRAVGDL